MKRFAAIGVVVVLLMTACGGDSDDTGANGGSNESGSAQVTTTQAESEDAGSDQSAPATTSAADDGESEGSGPSTATVTLGGETYNFSAEGAIVAQCLTDLFGIFSVQLPMIDDSGAQAEGFVSIVALHEGTDPDVVGEVNAIEVAIGDEDWVADEADLMFDNSELLEPGMGQVDSVKVDGQTVSGTATFFRQNSLFTEKVDILTGSFEATCGEERTS